MAEIARVELHKLGVELPEHPPLALLRALRIANGELEYWRSKVMELGPGLLVGNPVSTVERPLDLGKDGENPEILVTERREAPPEAHVYLKLMHEAQDRVVKYSAIALRANIEQKKIDLDQRHGTELAERMRFVLRKLGHDPADAAVRKIFARVSQKTCRSFHRQRMA